jgi:prevent-host-death family protein
MIQIAGVDAVASITELRSGTTVLLEHVRERRHAVLIQKNNVPYAVLVDWETYQMLLETKREADQPADRAPRRRGRERKPAETDRAA